MSTLRLVFGAFAEPLSRQLVASRLRVARSNVRMFQRDADAITLLRIRGMLTGGETAKARQRLLKQVAAAVIHKAGSAR